MAEWLDVIQSMRVILHRPGVKLDFLALVKMAETQSDMQERNMFNVYQGR